MVTRTYFIPLMALVAAAYAVFMIAFTWHQLVDVFQLGDPTGLFGFLMQVGGFVSNLCVILIAALFLLPLATGKTNPIPHKTASLIFSIKLLEGLSLSPCAVGFGDAFCGFWWVILSMITSPVLIAITLIFLFSADKKALVRTGKAIVGGVLLAGIMTFFILTPKNADACMTLAEVTDRAACLEKFALRENDVTICRQIEFRSTRFDCLYNVARDTESPAICEEIADPEGTVIAAYETPASSTRDLCYYLLGFKMHSQDMCQKVGDEKMRNTCMNGAGTPGQKRRLF